LGGKQKSCGENVKGVYMGQKVCGNIGMQTRLDKFQKYYFCEHINETGEGIVIHGGICFYIFFSIKRTNIIKIKILLMYTRNIE
jgi:hypothetical protein